MRHTWSGHSQGTIQLLQAVIFHPRVKGEDLGCDWYVCHQIKTRTFQKVLSILFTTLSRPPVGTGLVNSSEAALPSPCRGLRSTGPHAGQRRPDKQAGTVADGGLRGPLRWSSPGCLFPCIQPVLGSLLPGPVRLFCLNQLILLSFHSRLA